MTPIILFCFAGRKANLELQLPFIRRILAEHKNVEYHIWNLARKDSDSQYLQTIQGERITVINDLHGHTWKRFDDVYSHYTEPEYRNCLFVKIDDDVVFIQTDRWAPFIEAIIDNPTAIVSAKVINNGACTSIEPDLWRTFKGLPLPLRDVHLSAQYADMCHYYALNHWRSLIAQPTQLIPTDDWLSINLVGYGWRMGCRITSLFGSAPPAGWPALSNVPECANASVMGDEGAFNMFPRLILQGFLACHLYFGPQSALMNADHVVSLQRRYARIGRQYRELVGKQWLLDYEEENEVMEGTDV